jgi:hypothetical protein
MIANLSSLDRRFTMWRTKTNWRGLVLVAGIGLTAACDEAPLASTNDIPGPLLAVGDTTLSSDTDRIFAQVERHANPLAMEVLVEKREHGTHDTTTPTRDHLHFTDDYVVFITTVAQRDEAYARAIAGVLLGTDANPGDKIAVYPARAPGVTASMANTADNASVGWLTHVLAPGEGYGGRKLAGDDVVDKALSVVFGAALGNTNNVSPGLVTDNVGNTNPAPLSEFPYFPGS